jgi:hypothetical protein
VRKENGKGKESPMTRVGFQCNLVRIKRYSGSEGVARCVREIKQRE